MTGSRRHLRYRTETTQLAKICFHGVPEKARQRPVLIANLSYSGCNLIAIGEPEEVAAGEDLVLQFDADDMVDLEVVRVERLTSRALALGCRFLD